MKKTAIMLLGLSLLGSCGKGSSGGSSNSSSNNYLNESEGQGSSLVPGFEQYASEFKLMNSQKSSLRADDLRYNQFVVSRNKSLNIKNYVTFNEGLRTVKLYGKKIVLGKAQTQQFYKLINKAQDIEKLIIHAEELEIHDPLMVYGTDVEIKVKKLSFFNDGKIDTTPVSKNVDAAKFTDGVDGLDAGNINLIAEVVQQDSVQVRFILDGGNGQKAGPGTKGNPGTKAHIVHGKDYFYYAHEHCVTYRRHGGRADMKSTNGTSCDTDKKKGKRSGNGSNAKIGGRPGSPGNAGIITTSNDLKMIQISTKGGKPGAEDAVRKGGTPGSPATTCAYHKYSHSREDYKSRSKGRYGCQTATHGKDAQPKKANSRFGKTGGISFDRDKNQWVTDSFLRSHLKFTKETFLTNNIFYTRNLINELKTHLKVAEKSLTSSQVGIELAEIESKIDMNLDFFGNKVGWVPNMAFEVNYDLFVKEVKRNIKLMYLAHRIKLDLQKGIVKLDDIKRMQQEYEVKILAREESINNMVSDQVLNSELLGELKTAQEEFEYELKLVEAEIKRRAKKNLTPKKKGFLDKAVKIFAAASKVIPVGQPALAAAGMGVEFIHNATNGSKTTSEILTELPGVYAQFRKADFKKSLVELNIAMDDMSPRHIPSLRTMEQKKEYFNKVKDFTSPIYKAVAGQLAMQKNRSIPRSELEKEIARLKKGNPLFNKLSEKLNVLLFKKTQVNKKLETLLANINKLNTEITEDTIVMSYLFDDVEELIKEDAIGFLEQMDSLYTKSLRRIEYYDYILSKSFSYRFLSPAPVGDNLSARLERVLAEINDEDSFDGNLETMWSTYDESLTRYVEDIIKKFENDGSTQSLSLEMELTKEELVTLNDGKSIYLNLVDRNIFGTNKEDLRIEDIEVLDDVGFSQSPGNFDIVTTHLGKALIEKNGETYYFDLAGKRNHWIWTSNYNYKTGHVYSNEVSEADGTLLRSITGANSEVRRAFVNPGARGFIKIKLDKYNNPQMMLERLTLRVDYTFRDKRNK